MKVGRTFAGVAVAVVAGASLAHYAKSNDHPQPRPSTSTSVVASPQPPTNGAEKLPACNKKTRPQDCYKADSLETFIRRVNTVVQPTVTQHATDADFLWDPALHYMSQEEFERTVCGDASDLAFAYCPAGAVKSRTGIYIGQQTLGEIYQLGEIAPMIGLAHEYGHVLQRIRGLPVDGKVPSENQCDCVAGWWYSTVRAYRESIGKAKEDDKAINALFVWLGEKNATAEKPRPYYTPKQGQPSQRRVSYDIGYKGGIKACNEFFKEKKELVTK